MSAYCVSLMLACAAPPTDAVAPLPPAFARPTFPAASSGAGELMHIHRVPILTLRGTPAEMGDQFGQLAIANAPGLSILLNEFLTDTKTVDGFEGLKSVARGLRKQFPPAHLVEMDAAARSSGFDLPTIYFANSVYDLASGMGCATVLVDPTRSRTGQPLLGRNFDWVPSHGMSEHTLVVVYRPTGKQAFLTVTTSPIVGCITGMNESGLVVAINQILLRNSKDKASINWSGTPTLALYRQVLEECRTVHEAEQWVRKANRMTAACMSLSDPTGGRVLEFTPKTVSVRTPPNGLTCCTNVFCSDELCVQAPCWRLEKLAPLERQTTQLGVPEVFAQLHSVNQGTRTLQTMVFEPATKKLHLKYGPGPASAREAVELDLLR